MTLLRLALAACVFAAAASPIASAQPARSAPIAADVIVDVNGLVCDFCAHTIERNLKKRAEVAAVRVDLSAKQVRIDLREPATLDDATIRRLITESGYAVVGVRRTGGG